MSERTTIARHAGTVLAGQLAVMAFGVTDTIVAGRHSAGALAALSIGSAIYVSIYVALMGALQALLPIWAEQRGAGEREGIGRTVRQALYLCAIACAIGMAVLVSPGAILRWTQVPEDLRAVVGSYLGVLALALPPALLFRVYSTLNQALGRPQLVTWLQVGSLLVKIPLSIWFTFGGVGVPAQGAVGCAWATLLVNYALLGVSLWLLNTQPLYVPLGLWRRMEKPDWKQIGRFAQLGVPAGLAILVEVTSFTLMALFIARQGNVAAAAHQIASNLTAVLYMVPLSLSIAISARVSFWIGSGNEAQARAAAWMGFRLSAGTGIVLAAILFIAKDHIAPFYTSSAQVALLTASLLTWVSCYHVADALQTVCVFVLRCYRVTLAPLIVYCVMLWGAGLSGGYFLAYEGTPGVGPLRSPAAFWGASAAALSITAAIFVAMLAITLKPGKPLPPPAS
ncbi:MATE family efflux transporter [Acidovorax sp. SUPP3334]|uniref:MATE family efflux transporter n=1 Tax=Acidovorax sp. SUPP3334 TaxID=2920881 RepID=UPI0023DE38AF|nr:MATE family efflux transporter [Acidovorax sp. SUPP3334]GKT24534.1 MATE family efflux transporter [Acidovorax sp. SUPP3334]